jgi:hypothetical protein
MKSIKVRAISDINEIKEKDTILFLKPSMGRLRNSGGADYILSIDKSSPDLAYEYNPSDKGYDKTFTSILSQKKVFQGTLFQLGRDFNLFRVENMTFEQTQEYLHLSMSNLAVLPQFFDTLSEMAGVSVDEFSTAVQQTLAEPLLSIIFCNWLNESFDEIHEIHFYGLPSVQVSRVSNPLKLLLGI